MTNNNSPIRQKFPILIFPGLAFTHNYQENFAKESLKKQEVR